VLGRRLSGGSLKAAYFGGLSVVMCAATGFAEGRVL